MKGGKAKRLDENIRDFQELMRQAYREHLAWMMTSSATGLGRDELLLHMSQLRNYWDNQDPSQIFAIYPLLEMVTPKPADIIY